MLPSSETWAAATSPSPRSGVGKGNNVEIGTLLPSAMKSPQLRAASNSKSKMAQMTIAPPKVVSKQFPVTPRDLLARKRTPIWLGFSGQPDAQVGRVPKVKSSVPVEVLEREGEAVQAAENKEQEAESLEAANRFVQASEQLEEALNTRRRLAGDNHNHTILAFERLCNQLNTWAVKCLSAGQPVAALEMLKKAELLTAPENAPDESTKINELRCRTFSNLCCYFRARGKQNAALQFAEKALRLERASSKEGEDPARVRLNYAVLLSAMGRHGDAIQQLELAAATLRESEQGLMAVSRTGATWETSSNRQLSVGLVVAYHNLWVEHGKLSNWTESADYLLRAVNFSRQRLGGKHALTLKMMESLDSSSQVQPAIADQPSPRTQAAMARSLSPPTRPTTRGTPTAATLVGITPSPSNRASPRLPSLQHHHHPHQQQQQQHQQQQHQQQQHQQQQHQQQHPRAASAQPSDTRELGSGTSQLLSVRPYTSMGIQVSNSSMGGASPREKPFGAFFAASGDGSENHSRPPSGSPRNRTATSRWGSPAVENMENEITQRASRRSVTSLDPASIEDPKGRRAGGARTVSPRMQQLRTPASPPTPQSLPGGQATAATSSPPGKGRRVLRHAQTTGPETIRRPASLPPEGEADEVQSTGSHTPRAALGNSRKAVKVCSVPWCSGTCDASGTCRDCGKVREDQRVQGTKSAGSGAGFFLSPTSTLSMPPQLRPNSRNLVPTPPLGMSNGFEDATQRLQSRHLEWYSQDMLADAEATLEKQQKRIDQLSVGKRSPTSTAGGPFDNRRREAFMIVHNARRTYVENRAALKIQKVFRGHSMRVHLQNELAHTAHATAAQMQSLFRRYAAVKQANRRKQAAIVIQTRWRRLHEFTTWRRRLRSQRYVTRLVEGYLARRFVHRLLHAVIVFQRLIRGFLTRSFVKRRESARIRLQKVLRGTVLRRRTARIDAASARIAADWHGYRTRRWMKKRHSAAILIQSNYRRWLDRRRVSKRQRAAARIRAAWLGHRVRRRVQSEFSIALVQAHIRGALTRRRIAQWAPAAAAIQRVWRARQRRRRFRTRVAIAVVLQKHARRHKVTRQLSTLHVKAIGCQRIFRACYARKVQDEREAVALRIQAIWYMAVARWQVKDMHRAAKLIQATARLAQARRHKEMELAKAARLHAFWEGVKVRRFAARVRKAALVIQRCYRGHHVRREARARARAALMIESCWRAYLSRVELSRRHAAARKLQKAWRLKYHLNRWHNKFRHGMVRLQSVWRAKKASRELAAKRRVAFAMQAVLRSRRNRLHFQQENDAALAIQCAWRCLVARRSLRRANVAARTIQRAVQRRLEQAKVREMTRAATRVQKVVRGIASRAQQKRLQSAKRICAWLRGRFFRLRFLKKREAAIRLQRSWRHAHARRSFRQLQKGASTVTGFVKFWLFRIRKQVQHRSAVRIQAAWRRKAQHFEQRRRLEAAVCIQSFARRLVNMVRLQQKLVLATKLQAHARRKCCQRHLADLQSSQEQIARLARCREAERASREMHEAAHKIGSLAKMYLTSKRLAEQSVAAIKIQRNVRGWQTRRRVHQMVHVAPVGIQNLQRCIVARRRMEQLRYEQCCREVRDLHASQQEELRRRVEAATRLQAWVRHWRAERWYREKVQKAVPLLQGFCRMLKAKAIARTRLRAVHVIRTWMAGKHVANLARKHHAATRIQTWWRRQRQKHIVGQNSYAVRAQACTKIQAAVRGKLARRRYQRQRRAAMAIQGAVRAFIVRRRVKRKVAAATKIQTVLCRGVRDRRFAAHRRSSALFLQAHLRQFLWARRAAKRKAALRPLQAAIRGLIRRNRRQILEAKAATKIQAFWRMRRHRPGGDRNYITKGKKAVLFLQAFARGHLVRRHIQMQHQMAMRIQRRFRYRRFKRIMARYRFAATRIQRVVRSSKRRIWVRKRLATLRQVPGLVRGWLWRKRHFPVVNKAATDIQRVYQGGLHREALIQMMLSAIQLQTWWRCLRAQLRYKKIQRLKQILLMLVYRRRYVMLRRGHHTLTTGIRRAIHCQMPQYRRRRLNRAALVIQRWQRGYACRTLLQKRFDSAALIQATCRSVMAWQDADLKEAGITKIQARMRGSYDRGEHRRTLELIKSLQNWVRSRYVRDRFLEKVEAVNVMQRIFRGNQIRARLAQEDAASTTIGRVWRGTFMRKRYDKIGPAARKIQRCYRASVIRRRCHKEEAAATLIQSTWRRYCQRNIFVAKRRAGAYLVRGAWMWRQMHMQSRRRRAALRIGAWWRGYCVRQNLEAVQKAVDRIRSWWRSMKSIREATEAVVDLLALKRRLRREYQYNYAVMIQRQVRSWLALTKGFRRYRAAVVTIQSHYRRRKAVEEVEFWREVVGPNMRRLPSQLVALMPDSRKRLTKYRAFRPGEKVTKMVARIVRLRVLRKHITAAIVKRIAPLQAFVRHRRRMKKLVVLQAAVRGWLARRKLRAKSQSAIRVQALARGVLARRRVQRRVEALVKLQAHFRGSVTRHYLKEHKAEEAAKAAKEPKEEGEEGLPPESAAEAVQS